MAPTASTFKPYVVSFGDEDFFLDRDIEKAQQVKRRILKLDAADGLTDQQLVDHCEGYSEVPRTIIVDNAQKVKGDKVLKAFIENHEPTDPYLVIVAIIRSTKLPEVWSLAISKAGKSYERKKPKPWEADEYLKFITNEATLNRIVIPGDVASVLLQYVGQDYYRLSNEIQKLAVLVGQAATVKKEHIARVTTPTPQATPHQVAEAVLAKNGKQAMTLFSHLYTNSGDDSLIPVVHALMREVEKTTIVRSLQDKGVSESEIAVLLGHKEWKYKNLVAPIARKHDLRSLVRHMGRLARLDADVKGPSRSKRTLVEMAVLSIAQ